MFKISLLNISLIIVLSGCLKTETTPDNIAAPNIKDSVNNVYLTIDHDTTFTNRINGTDYRICNRVKIINGATLTIEKGTTVEVVQNGAIEVRDGSALKVNGTITQPVYITGQSKVKGYWRGLYFYQTANPNNKLNNCIIEYAGSEYSDITQRAAINNYGSTLQLDSCTIKFNKHYGIYLDTLVTAFSMSATKITKNDKNPVLMYHTNCDFLTGNGNDFIGNSIDLVLIKSVLGVNTSRTLNFNKINIAYSFEGTCRFAEPVIVAPGCKFTMQLASTLFFDNSISGNAQLIANGTPADSIIFRGALPQLSQWDGIGFNNGGICQLQYCRISECGTCDVGGVSPMGMLCTTGPGNCQLTVQHCKFKLSEFNALVIKSPETNYNSDISTINAFESITGDIVHLY